MISTVIFDVGGVLVRTVDYSSRRNLEKQLGLKAGESETVVFNAKMGTAAQLGQITSAQLWQGIKEHLKLNRAELVQFRDEFFGGDQLNTQLMDFIQSLRPQYKTAIISNASDNLLDVLTTIYPIVDDFDLIIGSAYEGVMKPDAIIFKRALKRLGCRPEETIFVDDFTHNVDGARAVGMNAIHFTPDTDIPAAFAKYQIFAANSA